MDPGNGDCQALTDTRLAGPLMRAAPLVVLIFLLAGLLWLIRQTLPEASVEPGLRLDQLLGAAPPSFSEVREPAGLEFPRDHARHDAYRHEWWYFSGNLFAPDQRRFGFQFTLFRFAMEPAERPTSAWSTDHIWMAHFAISDVKGRGFHSAERFARDALDLAGATAYRWWLRDWQVTASDQGWRLRADSGEFEIDLTLRQTRPLVLQGRKGYSRKGPEPGQASFYYSATRLQTTGALRLGPNVHSVSGLGWLDREWGSGQLDEATVGWDWFAVHLADGRDLMLYRLRDRTGQPTAFSAGTLVDPDGRILTLGSADFSARPIRHWTDAQGHSWPLEWRIEVPGQLPTMRVRATFDAQHWQGAVSYWEGAIDVIDPVRAELLGHGYMELSGY